MKSHVSLPVMRLSSTIFIALAVALLALYVAAKPEELKHRPLTGETDVLVGKILKLKALKDASIIDEAEFSRMKAEIIFRSTGAHLFPDDEEMAADHAKESSLAVGLEPRAESNKDVYEDFFNAYSSDVDNVTYSLTTTFLLNSFTQGLPRSYRDVLPTGQNFWTTPMYLQVGALNPYGQRVPLDSATAIQERTLTRYGLNLYDGATWCIALYLEGLGDVVDMYYRNILYTSTTGPMGIIPGGLASIRANKPNYNYGPTQIAGNDFELVGVPDNVTYVPYVPFLQTPPATKKTIVGSYFYRMIGPLYSMPDPFNGAYANAWKFPFPNNDTSTPWNIAGEIHWNDWKPITGENVWGAILGPLQTLWINNGTDMASFTTFATSPPEVQFALSIMPAINAMVTPMGGLYHCPKGTQMFPADPSEQTNVSNENNFSGFASLTMLYELLHNKTVGTSDPVLVAAMTDLETILQGFQNWFSTQLLPAASTGELRVIYQGGHVPFSGGFEPVNISHYGGLAVDCQTWGMTVVGQAFMDQYYGAGSAYEIWQTTKKAAGYYNKQGVLGGVGYTAGSDNLIWSAEWTWGAINMAKKLAYEYALIGETAYSKSLAADAASMLELLTQPIQRCANGAWCGGGLLQEDGSYMYANQRFFIPWGWYANPIAATCSTAWAIMNKHDFNPFILGGGYTSVYPMPTQAQLDKVHETYFELFGELPKGFEEKYGVTAIEAYWAAKNEAKNAVPIN